MASLILLVSEFLHPHNMQIDSSYYFLPPPPTAAAKMQNKNHGKVSKVEESENKGAEKTEEVASLVLEDDLPQLWLDSELVWP